MASYSALAQSTESERSRPALATWSGDEPQPKKHGFATEITARPASLKTAYSDITSMRGPPSRATDHLGLEIPDWPPGATPLRSRRAGFHFEVVIGILLSIAPIMFFVLAAYAYQQNGAPVQNDSFEKYLLQASNLSPTVFPILFTAIMGATLRNVARYAAEKGTELGVLEALMGSQTIVGTLEVLWYLRRVPLLSVILLVFWTLSPLGGQGGLRLLYQTDRYVYSDASLKYLDTSPNGTAYNLYTLASELGAAGTLAHNTLFGAAMLSDGPSLALPQDTFGNVRIPRLTVEQLASTDNSWFDVGNITQPEEYYSMLGTPVAGMMEADMANFTLNSTYVSLSCSPPQLFDWDQVILDTNSSNTTEWLKYVGPLQQDHNPAAIRVWGEPWDPAAFGSSSFMLDLQQILGGLDNTDRMLAAWNTSVPVNATTPPQTLIYGSAQFSLKDGTPQIMITDCSLYSDFVESLVECRRNGTQTCAVKKIRPQLEWQARSNLTIYDGRLDLATLPVFSYLPGFGMSGSYRESNESSPLEWFLNDTTTSIFSASFEDKTDGKTTFAGLLGLTPEQFGDRLSLVLNTYWITALAPLGLNAGLPSLERIPTVDQLLANPNLLESSRFSFAGKDETANLTHISRVWVCDIAWLCVLIATSSIALLFGLSAIPLRYFTHGPDMLGYVSSLTYDNKYVPLETGGTLEGLDRSRLLQKVRVRIGDVRGDDEIGHVAFALDNDRVAPLSRTKLYM